MMKKISLLLIIGVALIACSNTTKIKNTEWTGIEQDGNTSIVFNDSTCEIYKKFETGYADTIKAAYVVYNDTISFAPFNEAVTIGSKLIVSGNELKESKSGRPVFKLKE